MSTGAVYDRSRSVGDVEDWLALGADAFLLLAGATRRTALGAKHSGFFDTTLDTFLETLRIRRVIVTGIAGNICVLFTANDAYMRDFKLFAPADCIVSNTAADNEHALRQIATVLKGNVTDSSN